MAFEILKDLPVGPKPAGYRCWTTHQGMSGWKAVSYWWNPEGFWEPYDTGVGRYEKRKSAYQEAEEQARHQEQSLLHEIHV